MIYKPVELVPFGVTVDIVVLTLLDGKLRVALIQRGDEPFRDHWALPGGPVRPEESLIEAAKRVLKVETNIAVSGRERLKQFRSYYEPGRDPRMNVTTTVYWTIANKLPDTKEGGSAKKVELVPVREIESGRRKLAFDHRRIIKDGTNLLRDRLEDTTVATRFCGQTFSISDLRQVYNIVWNTDLDEGNFQRKVKQSEGFLSPLEKRRDDGTSGRPPALWKAGPARTISPPLTRPTDD